MFVVASVVFVVFGLVVVIAGLAVIGIAQNIRVAVLFQIGLKRPRHDDNVQVPGPGQ